MMRIVCRYTCAEGYWYSPGVDWKEVFCEKSGFWEPDPTGFVCIGAVLAISRLITDLYRFIYAYKMAMILVRILLASITIKSSPL